MQAQEASAFVFFKLWPWVEANIKRIGIGISIAAAAAFLISFYFWQQNQKEVAAGQALTQLIVATPPNVSASELADSYLQIANTHPDTLVEDFKKRQADGVTANITREHHPGPIPHLHQLGESVRRMSNQLFLQSFATWELIIRTIREGTVYFVQRQPEELGDIAWVIDRKDQTLTQMEETWSTLILPLSERAFANEPLIGILEEDYSYFDLKYGFNRATIEPDELRHLQWLRSVSGKGLLGEDERLAVNAKLLLTEQRTFEDSRDSLGLQLADMLAATLRRALNDQLKYPGWKDFGGLLVRHHNPGTGFIQLGAGAEMPMLGHARRVCKILDSKAKSMVAE